MVETFFKQFNNLGRRIKKEGSTKIKKQINRFINKQKKEAKKRGYDDGYKKGIEHGIKMEKRRNISNLAKLKRRPDGTYLVAGYNVAIYEAQKRIRSNQ